MAEHPIIFSPPMVEAIIARRKTVTRRIIKAVREVEPGVFWMPWGTGGWRGSENAARTVIPTIVRAPEVGDTFYVRERWAPVDWYATGQELDEPVAIGYADHAAVSFEDDNVHPLDTRGWDWTGVRTGVRWHPSIHMPRYAARLELELVSKHAERLQDMALRPDLGHADVLAEGLVLEKSSSRSALFDGITGYGLPGAFVSPTPWRAFQALWDGLNGKPGKDGKPPRGPWSVNPWVWVYGFRLAVNRSEKRRRRRAAR